VPLAQARLHATAPLRGTSPDDMQAAENAALASVLTQAMALLARFATPRT
jgi:hypothetical protein